MTLLKLSVLGPINKFPGKFLKILTLQFSLENLANFDAASWTEFIGCLQGILMGPLNQKSENLIQILVSVLYRKNFPSPFCSVLIFCEFILRLLKYKLLVVRISDMCLKSKPKVLFSDIFLKYVCENKTLS